MHSWLWSCYSLFSIADIECNARMQMSDSPGNTWTHPDSVGGDLKSDKKKISLVWFYMMMLLLRWRCGTKFDYKTNYLNSVRTFPKMVQSDCPQHWGRRKRRQEEEERGGVQGEPDDAVSERRSSSSSAPSSSPSSHVPGRRRENGIGTRHVLLERNRCVVSIK